MLPAAAGALTGQQPGFHEMLTTRSEAKGQLEVIAKVRLY